VLLREVEQKINLFARLTECFTDYRNREKTEHTVEQMLRQRIYGIALGYELKFRGSFPAISASHRPIYTVFMLNIC